MTLLRNEEDREQFLLDQLAELQREKKARKWFMAQAILVTICVTFLTSYFVVVSTSNHCTLPLKWPF